jgi:hypothetical protein
MGRRRAYLPAHDETLRGDGRRGRFGAFGVDNFLNGGQRLVVFQRARMALDVVPERHQLVDDFLIVELDAVPLELFGDFVDSLLRHTSLGLLAV